MSQQGALSSSSGGGGSSVSLSPYIVGATNADYTTIQAAINAAHTAGASNTNMYNVYIKPGTYTENLTLYDGVNLIGFTDGGETLGFIADSFGYGNAVPSVIVAGSVTFAPTVLSIIDKIQIKGIWIKPDAGDAVIVDLNLGGVVNLFFCDCQITINEAAMACFVITGTPNLYFKDTTVADLTFTLGTLARFIESPPPGSNITSIFAAGSAFFVNSGSNPLLIPSPINLWVDMDSTTWYPCLNGVDGGIRVIAQSCKIISDNGPSDYFINSNFAFFVILNGCSFGQTLSLFVGGTSGNYVMITNTDLGIVNNKYTSFPKLGVLRINNSSYLDLNTTSSEKIDKSIVFSFGGSQSVSPQAGTQTTNATLTVLSSVLINELESITLKGTITAAQSDHTNMVGGDFLITARRAAGGNVTLVGAVVKNVQSSSAATFDCDVDTGTQTVRITVTGVAATIYNWVTSYSYQKVLDA